VSKSSKKSQRSTVRGWIIIVALVVVVALVALVYQNQQVKGFTLVSGDQAVVVLLRDTQPGVYSVQYRGKAPTNITGVQVMLAGEILHMDVDSVMLINGKQEVAVVKNRVSAETPFVVEPGDVFQVKVNFLGQTLGYNYLYGFIFDCTLDGEEQTFQVTDKDFRFLVTVE